MPLRRITTCPMCDGRLEVTGLTCVSCGTHLEGAFPTTALARMTPEHQVFIETFVLCRGVIRDVERALDVSYPTVRARLDTVVDALQKAMDEAAAAQEITDRTQRRTAILQQVEAGKLTPAEAARRLQEM